MFSWKTREYAQGLCGDTRHRRVFGAGISDPRVREQGLSSYFVRSQLVRAATFAPIVQQVGCLAALFWCRSTLRPLQNYRRRCSGPLWACLGI